MWPWVLPIHVRNIEFLSPDPLLYTFDANTVRAHGHEKSRFKLILAEGGGGGG